MVRVLAFGTMLALAAITATAGPAAPAALAAEPVSGPIATYELEPERNAVAVRVELDVTGPQTTISIEGGSDDVTFVADAGTVDAEITGTSQERREYRLTLTEPGDLVAGPRRLVVSYDMPGGPPRSIDFTRASPAYATFCVSAFGIGGETRVTVPRAYEMRAWGSGLARSVDGDVVRYTSTGIDSLDWWACLGGANEAAYRRDNLTSPSGRRIVLESYPDDDEWRDAIRDELGTELRRVEDLMGRRLPGNGSLVVREVPYSDLDGYAGIFQSDAQLIRITEEYDQPGLVAHELSHAWFNETMFDRVWLAEGYAGWVEGRATRSRCFPPGGLPDGEIADLDRWRFLPEVPATSDIRMVDFQYDAACSIVYEVMERAGERGAGAILGALLERTNPYGADLDAPSAGSLDWRTWLDVVDELGLRPAGERDLDFTQVRMARFGAADDVEALVARKVARELYHDLRSSAGDWTLPRFVRAHLAKWQFEDATAALRAAAGAREAAREVDRLLPEMGATLTEIRADWEAAETTADLQRVERTAERLRVAAVRVARAKALAGSDGDPVQALGLVGTEMAPAVDAALGALQAGDLDTARAHADLVITTVEESARAGAARAAAVGVAALLLVVAGSLLWRRHATRPAVPPATGLPVVVPGPEPALAVRAAVPVTPGSARTEVVAAAALAVGALLLLAATVLERRRREARAHRS